jgi:hypothetical protein
MFPLYFKLQNKFRKKSKMYVVLPGLQDSCKQKKEAKAYKISAIKCPQLKHFLLVYDWIKKSENDAQ